MNPGVGLGMGRDAPAGGRPTIGGISYSTDLRWVWVGHAWKPTREWAGEIAAYALTCSLLSEPLGAVSLAVSWAARAGDPAGCAASFRVLDETSETFARWLDGHPAPFGLGEAVGRVRTAVVQFQRGARLGMQGVRQDDSELIARASRLFEEAAGNMCRAARDAQGQIRRLEEAGAAISFRPERPEPPP